MCGICGIISSEGSIDQERLIRLRDRMAHRGPDDAGVWISTGRNVGLAHRRLSIIDLSSAGHQPMQSPDGRLVITYNGEVYNFQELKSELEALGCRFYSNTDTEVVLAAYAQWGPDFVNRLNGMFALAIYDRGDEQNPPTLFFARDRAGKKPLYYRRYPGGFEFASELKGLGGNAGIDPVAVNHYLALGYIPRDLCFVSGVNKLPPGHAAVLDILSNDLKVYRYWELPLNRQTEEQNVEVLTDQVEKLLMESVRLRLIADVPVGVLLSGGLDSSLVVAAAAKQSSRAVRTFTIAVPGTRFDESAHARQVADYFSTEHHVLDMHDLSMGILDDIANLVDEPLADSSMIPSYVVSRLTRQHVTVALGGDGGDELFGGYSDYPVSLGDQERWRWIPATIMRLAAAGASRLPAGVRGRNRLASLQGGALQQMIWGTPYFDTVLRQRILATDATAVLGDKIDAPERFLLGLFLQGSSPVDAMTRTHFGSILPDDFMVKVDRTSMAHSLEMRSPFLDYRLVEFCFSMVPDEWKVVGNRTRRLQKRLARRLLPPDLDIDRKQGFSIPMDEWLRQDRCGMLMDHMGDLPDMISQDEVRRLIDGHMRGRANGSRLFALLMLAIAARNIKCWK